MAKSSLIEATIPIVKSLFIHWNVPIVLSSKSTFISIKSKPLTILLPNKIKANVAKVANLFITIFFRLDFGLVAWNPVPPQLHKPKIESAHFVFYFLFFYFHFTFSKLNLKPTQHKYTTGCVLKFDKKISRGDCTSYIVFLSLPHKGQSQTEFCSNWTDPYLEQPQDKCIVFFAK